MSKSFILLDKSNNSQRIANVIVKFSFEGKDYLVYSVEENEQNSQIFVSRLILNSEGKYFIDNILPDEKGKLNNIVYNIVILLPTEAQKGSTFEVLNQNLFDKFAVKLSSNVPELHIQEYYSNCSIAITNKVLVDVAVKLYSENLNRSFDSSSTMIPTWTAPTEVTSPVEAPIDINVNAGPVPTPTIVAQETILPNSNLQTSPVVNEQVLPVQVNSDVTTSAIAPLHDEPQTMSNTGIVTNPQVEKLAVISDPSLSAIGVNVQQPNVRKLKKAGFANTKYVVIGTVCLLLAVAVVITAYILIKNM